MKKIIKLTENDLNRIVEKVINEQSSKSYNIYLAGPNVFKRNAMEDLNQLKNISKKYKQIGNAPLDNEVD